MKPATRYQGFGTEPIGLLLHNGPTTGDAADGGQEQVFRNHEGLKPGIQCRLN